MILKIILLVFVVLLAIPLGFWVAWITRDELIVGRKWLKIITYVCSFGALFSIMILNSEEGIKVGFSLIFVGILAYIGYIKSFDKRWTKRKRNL